MQIPHPRASLQPAFSAVMTSCSDSSSGSNIHESFYDGIERGLSEEGLPVNLATCMVDGVHKMDLTAADVTEFEETGGFSDELSDELESLTLGCFDE